MHNTTKGVGPYHYHYPDAQLCQNEENEAKITGGTKCVMNVYWAKLRFKEKLKIKGSSSKTNYLWERNWQADSLWQQPYLHRFTGYLKHI